MHTSNIKYGFTIVELVIAIAVIAILAAVLVPTFSNVLGRANEASAYQEAVNALKAYVLDYPNVQSYTVGEDTYYAAFYKVKKGATYYAYRYNLDSVVEEFPVDEWPSFNGYFSIKAYTEIPMGLDETSLGNSEVKIYKRILSNGRSVFYVEKTRDGATEILMQFGTDAYYVCEDDYYALTNLDDIEFGEPEPSVDDSSIFVDSNGITYKSLGDGTAKVLSYEGSATSVIVSSYLSNGDQVVSIERHAFSNNSTLKNVVVSEGIKTLIDCSFYNCKALQSIQLPSSLESIGYFSFKYCSSLKSIVLPVNCVIEEGAFTTVVDFSFAGDSPYETSRYRIVDGCLIDKTTNTLVAYYGAAKDVVIPGNLGIAKVGNRVFACSSIETITVPSSVKVLGIESFYNCSKLTEIFNCAALESIGAGCFCACSKLASLTLPQTLTTIGNNAFNGCNSLEIILENSFQEQVFCGVKSITLSSGETSYRKESDCIIRNSDNTLVTATANADISAIEGATVLGAKAFSYCTLSENVVIPHCIKEIQFECFYACNGIKTLTVNDSVETLGQYCFGYMGSLGEIVLNSPLDSLPVGFCSSCSKLTTITLPASIQTISSKAISNCTSLKTIYFGGTVAAWKSINFASDWHSGTSSFTVICTDGEIGYV